MQQATGPIVIVTAYFPGQALHLFVYDLGFKKRGNFQNIEVDRFHNVVCNIYFDFSTSLRSLELLVLIKYELEKGLWSSIKALSPILSEISCLYILT